MSGETINRTLLAVVVVLTAVVVGGVAFYFGRMSGLEQTPSAPTAAEQPTRPAGSNVTRLPTKRFENWNLACVQTPAKITRCTLMLEAVANPSNKHILTLAVVRNAKGKAMLLVVTPPRAILSTGVHLTPGSGKEITAQFVRCGQGACEAIAPLDEAETSAFAAATTTTVGFTAGTGKPVSLKVPTNGFAAGFAAWQASMPPVSGPAP